MPFQSTIAVIPARGGSKRLPRKNVRMFRGAPMIAWTVRAAIESRVFERIVVSTEDDEVAVIAREENAEVVARPDALADDATRVVEVVGHALETLGASAGELCILLANCPLRDATHIRASLAQFRQEQPAGLLSVVDYGWTPPFRSLSSGEQGLELTFGAQFMTKSQAYPKVVCPSGAIYWSRLQRFLVEPEIYTAGLAGYRMPWHFAIDIDELYDVQLAEALALALDSGALLDAQ